MTNRRDKSYFMQCIMCYIASWLDYSKNLINLNALWTRPEISIRHFKATRSPPDSMLMRKVLVHFIMTKQNHS